MLSKRLSAIAQLVNNNSVVADIGSDHGLLPCFLLKEKIAKKAYAIDNKKGPLQASIENIKYYDLENKVEAVLADGLDDLENDVNSIVIAGMGFISIKNILESNVSKLNQLSQIIIQSNTETNLLRKWVMDNKYLICDEVIVKENYKDYFIIEFNPQKSKNYKINEYLVSEILLNKNDLLYIKYLSDRLEKLKIISKFRDEKNINIEIDIIKKTLKNSD